MSDTSFMNTTQPVTAEERQALIERDFEEFCYVVSHDLQSPLRHIREFSKLLTDSFNGDLTDNQKQYAQFMQQGVVQSEQMLISLLEFSRINTRALPMVPIETGSIIRQVLNELSDQIEITGAKINYENLPEIQADQSQIRRLFHHLIDNSIKFRKPNTCPIINITATKQMLYYQFSVEDNGIGIDLQDPVLPFKLFYKDHAADNIPGVGAGLSLAQKIIHRHGGSIWLEESDLGGARVCFTVMKQNVGLHPPE